MLEAIFWVLLVLIVIGFISIIVSLFKDGKNSISDRTTGLMVITGAAALFELIILSASF